jgi:hypothetical protein
VLAPETVTFLEGGCALIVGTASTSGEPHATRGWGASVVATDPLEIRLLIDADDAVAIECLSTTGAVAFTGADVPTLHSIQFKGTVSSVEPADDEDRARAGRFCDAFFGDVVAVDGTARMLLDRIVPRDFVACTVAITELYDQTPGPAAGASLAERST